MSRTRKDARKIEGNKLSVIGQEGGTFNLLLNGELKQNRISERSLAEELCVRYGYCGEEYQAILFEVTKNGKKDLFFS